MLFFLNTYIPTILYKIFSIYIMPEHDGSETGSDTDNDDAVNASDTELDTDNEDEDLDHQTPYDGRPHGQSHEQGGLINNRHLQHITHIDPENKSDGYQQRYQEHLKNDYGGENLINAINNETGNKRRFDENVPQRMMDNAATDTGNQRKVILQKKINKRQRLKEGGKKSRKKRRKTKKGKSKRRKGKTRSKRRNQKKRRKTKKKKKNNTK